jgi:PAS domain S-box-containing protein
MFRAAACTLAPRQRRNGRILPEGIVRRLERMQIPAYKVLFVEDDPTHFLLTRELISLSKVNRYELEWVSEYDAALKRIRAGRHDACLVDHVLERRTGLELVREAVQSGCRAPIIMLTAYPDSDLESQVMQAGAADYLVKGQITADLLERSIRHAIERQRATEALRASEEYARCIIDSSLDMIVAVDLDRNITQFNRAAESTFGYQAQEVIGKPSNILYADPNDGDAIRNTVFRTGHHMCEVTNLRNNGQTFLSLVAASVLHDASGKQIGFMGVFRDITERKRLESEVLQLNQDLERRVIERTLELQRLNVELKDEISRRQRVQEEHESTISELHQALAQVKTLSGLLPICSNCKKIRDDQGYWKQLESYLREHSNAEFTHGICPQCAHDLYGAPRR